MLQELKIQLVLLERPMALCIRSVLPELALAHCNGRTTLLVGGEARIVVTQL